MKNGKPSWTQVDRQALRERREKEERSWKVKFIAYSVAAVLGLITLDLGISLVIAQVTVGDPKCAVVNCVIVK